MRRLWRTLLASRSRPAPAPKKYGELPVFAKVAVGCVPEALRAESDPGLQALAERFAALGLSGDTPCLAVWFDGAKNVNARGNLSCDHAADLFKSLWPVLMGATLVENAHLGRTTAREAVLRLTHQTLGEVELAVRDVIEAHEREESAK